MRSIFSIVLLLFVSFAVHAQSWEVGAFAGSSGYMGDINPVRPYKYTDFAYGGQVKRNFDGYWSLKLNLMHGKIQADDAQSPNLQQQRRNLNFFSPLTELSLQTEFNFFNYLPGIPEGYGAKRFSPYLFTGVGLVSFMPKTVYNNEVVELPTYMTEDVSYSTYALSVPYGLGFKYNFLGYWNLIGEAGYRTAFTDYLDDVSGKYPQYLGASILAVDNDDLSDPSVPPKVGGAGIQRGDFRKRDTYMFVGLSLTYTFVSKKCYSF